MTDPNEPQIIFPENTPREIPPEDALYAPPQYPPPAYSAPPPPTTMYVPAPQRRFSGCGWLLAIPFACLAIAAVAVLLAIVLPLGAFSGVVQSLLGNLNIPTNARVVSSSSVLTSILPLGQLVTVSVQLAKADVTLSVSTGVLNACGFSNDYVAQGTIEAGIDLNAITPDDIAIDAVTGAVTITVPAPQLTSCRIDYIDKYANSVSACINYVSDDEARQLAQHQALLGFRDDALEGGILDRAERETRVALGSFVSALTGEATTLVFREAPAEPVYTSSCAPDVPTRWYYDPVTRNYSR